jgi:hypothetical protein
VWHVFPVADTLEIRLRGAHGEPVDFARTIVSHGVAELPPNRVELQARVLETTVAVPRGARTSSVFYTLVSEDGDLSWSAIGAGRMLRAPTVF